MRIETVMNSPRDLGCWPACPTSSSRPRHARSTTAYWKPNVPARAPSSRAQPLSGSRSPSLTADGRRTPALRFGDPRVMALAGALCNTLLAATGITNKSLRALMTGLLHAPYTPGQMTYDLRRLRLDRADPPDPAHQPLRPDPRRHQGRDLLHQGAQPAAAPAARRRPAPGTPPNSAPPCAPSTSTSTAT